MEYKYKRLSVILSDKEWDLYDRAVKQMKTRSITKVKMSDVVRTALHEYFKRNLLVRNDDE